MTVGELNPHLRLLLGPGPSPVHPRVLKASMVNDAAGYTHEIPFGGFKESGLGREGGKQGLAMYLEVKSVVLNLG